jgi:hypothetical protein
MKNCRNCKYWNNKQSELGYKDHLGICISPRMEWNSETGASVSLIDRSLNRDGLLKHNTILFESVKDVIPYGSVNTSQYALAANENFGCINFKEIK